MHTSSLIFRILVALLVSAMFEALHLSGHQMHSVRHLLNNPELPISERYTIQRILYVSHEKWAVKKAKEFKEFHRHKCRDIPLEDLVLSSKIGLFKSADKYNGSSNFVAFSEIYVKSELLRTMTSYLSVTSCVSKRDRMSANPKPPYRKVYSYISAKSEEPQPLDKTQQFEYYDEIWGRINAGDDAFTKRVFQLKYDREFNVKRSNKRISELMCCSEETVRICIGNEGM